MASMLQSSNMQRDVVNDLASTVENLKISTLVNAAKISPLIQERTIGPKQSNGLESNASSEHINNRCDSTTTTDNNNKLQKNGVADGFKFRKDVWREVNLEKDETPKKLLQFNDCKAISFRLAASNAEKQRRAKISTDLQEKQCQWDSELEQRMQQIRIDSAEKQKQNQAKRLERERLALKAIEQIEDEAKQDELKSDLMKSEMIEHSRKLIEHANRLKKQDELRLLLESANASKNLFISLFELFAKTIVNHQGLLNQTGKLEDYTSKRDALLQQYEKMITTINSKPITMADIEQLEMLCSDVKQEQLELNEHIQTSKESISENVAAATVNVSNHSGGVQVNSEATIQNAADALKAINANEVSATDGTVRRLPNPASSQYVGSNDRIAKYNELINFYREYEAQIQPFITDVNLKKFRMNCQKGVNVPVNAIAATSVEHLQVCQKFQSIPCSLGLDNLDKFEKISDLLSGRQVAINGVPFTASDHQLGIKYCTFLLAKKFITQGSTATSTNNYQTTFAIAAVIVSIWQIFPDVGKLFLASLYLECPFFVPFYVSQTPGQSENDYYSALGYTFKDNVMEKEEQYLKRISGLQMLYSAVLITKLKQAHQHLEHPHGLENGWIWLSNFLLLDPLPGSSPTLLLEFIQICAADLWQVYKKQFMKLLMVLHDQYIPKLDKVDSGGPCARLKMLITKIVTENRITPPVGVLRPNFW